jgi:hypothetical protein
MQIVEGLAPQIGLVNGHLLGSFLDGGSEDRHPLASLPVDIGHYLFRVAWIPIDLHVS